MSVALALLLAACGGSDDTASDSTDVDNTADESDDDASATTDPDTSDDPAAPEPTTAPENTQPPVEPPADIADSNIAKIANLRFEAGGETVETALMSFTMQFGSLPGIFEAPEFDGIRAPSGTGALEAVLEVWDDLDEPTREAIRERIRPYIGNPDEPTGDDENAAGSTDEARLMSFASQPSRSQLEWEMRMQTMATAVQSRLGGDPLSFEVVLVDPSTIGGDATTGPDFVTVGASYLDYFGIAPVGGVRGECVFSIGEAQFQSPRIQEGVAAHEMFHCWSITNATSLDTHIATPEWFQEGVATWVGETLAGSGVSGMSGWVRLFLRGNGGGIWSLYHSNYDAYGFWSWVEDQGVDLWGIIPNLFTVAQTGEDDQLLAAVDSFLPGDGIMNGGSGPVLESGWGSAWTMNVPTGATSGRRAFEDTAQRGNPSVFTALPGMQGYGKVRIEAPVAGEPFIFQFQGAGWGRARWASGEEITMSGESVGVAWCVGGECVCPDGSSPSISFTSAAGAEGPVSVALQGGPGSSSDTRITILSMDDVCDPTTCPATDGGFERASPEASGTPLPEPPAPAEVAPAARPDCIVDLCMVGNWVAADVAEVEAYLTTLYRAAPVTPVFERGTMGAQFFDDGTALFTLDAAWGATAPTGEELLITTLSETDVFWSADGSALEYTVLQIRQDTTIEAGPVFTTGPAVIGGGPSDPVGTSSVAYSCEGGAFVIEGGVPFFPLPSQWTPA